MRRELFTGARLALVSVATLLGHAACRTRPLDVSPDSSNCSPVSAAPLWATAQHDSGRTSRTSAIGPDRYNERWRSSPQPGSLSNLTVGADGTIYFVAQSSFYAMNSTDGSILWQVALGTIGAQPIPSVSLDAAGAAIITLFGSPRVISIDLAARRPRWDVMANCEAVGPATIGNNGVAYLDCIGQIDALNPCDGHSRWSDSSGSTGIGEVGSLGAGGSLIGSGSGAYLASIDPDRGSVLWSFAYDPKSFKTRIGPRVVRNDGFIYLLLSNSGIGRVGNESAQAVYDPTGYDSPTLTVFQTWPGNPLFSALAVNDDTSFVGSENLVWAYYLKGHLLQPGWGQPITPDVPVTIVVAGNSTLYLTGSLGAGRHQIFALDGAGSGTIKWSAETTVTNCSVLVENTLYCVKAGANTGTFQIVAVGP